MPTNILMPALSPTMTEGTLARWLKKEGEEIKAGDVIAEIETDKATMEVEAVDEGTLGKILVPDGTAGVKVNDPIAVLVGEGEDASAASAPAAPKAESAVLTTRETINKKPSAPTRPRPTARVFTTSVTASSPSGCAFQITFSDVCNSPNTPVAVMSKVTTPITVAQMPASTLLALSIMDCTASAPSLPIRPRNCSTIAPRAASSPNTSPAMAMQITSNGAMENTV